MQNPDKVPPVSKEIEKGFVFLLLIFSCLILFGVFLLSPGVYKLIALFPVCAFIVGVKHIDRIVEL